MTTGALKILIQEVQNMKHSSRQVENFIYPRFPGFIPGFGAVFYRLEWIIFPGFIPGFGIIVYLSCVRLLLYA